MPESFDESDLSLPCPSCDYDLRAQTDPRCPECGRSFASIAELRVLAIDARRIFNRVMRWRNKFAFAYALSFALGFLIMTVIGLAVRQPSVVGTFGLLIVVAPFVVMPVLAFGFLIQVLRLRFAAHIGRAQRRELNGTIPLLMVYMLPGLISLPTIAMLVFQNTSMGAGI